MDYDDNRRRNGGAYSSERSQRHHDTAYFNRAPRDDRDYQSKRHSQHDTREKTSNKSSRSRSRSRSRSSERSSYSESSFNKNYYSHNSSRGGFQKNKNEHYSERRSNYNNNSNTNTYSSYTSGPNSQPSKTIMLRQLPIEMDDSDLTRELNMLMVPYKDIRLVKSRETNMNRGFAFIEFNTIEEAQRWMNLTNGWLLLNNYDNKIQLFYSHSEESQKNSSSSSDLNTQSEWDCAKVIGRKMKNFKLEDLIITKKTNIISI